MAYIRISETQFALTFFHKYLLLNKLEDITFLFPTLRQEGDPTLDIAGADLIVNSNLFFQFKMVEILKTRNASEIFNGKIPDIDPPFFRLWIKNSLPSEQFNLLKKAASKGYIVRYISPLFDYSKTNNDDLAFEEFLRASPINAMDFVCSIDFEQFIKPDHPLSSDNTHKICYSRESIINHELCYIFSEPKAIKIRKGLQEFEGQILRFPEKNERKLSIQNTLIEVIETFNLEIDTNEISVERIQAELIGKFNIFWIPVIQSKSERRLRIIREIK